MQVQIGGGSNSDSRLLADYREWDGMVLPVGLTGSGWAPRGMPLIAAGSRTWFSSSITTGGPGFNSSILDAAGPGWRIDIGGAGTVITRFAPQWLMSWWQDFTLLPASYTQRLRVSMSAIVETSATATEKPFIGMHNLGADLAGGGAGQSGIQLCYDSGVTNSWRVRSRLTPAAGLVNGNDSGIPAGVKLKVEFRYWQSAVPIVEVLVNDQVLQTFAGVANLPVPAAPFPAAPAAAVSGGFQATIGVIGAIGGPSSFIARQARYTVETLVP